MRLIDFKSYVEPVSTGAMLGTAGISAGGQVASGLFKPSLKETVEISAEADEASTAVRFGADAKTR